MISIQFCGLLQRERRQFQILSSFVMRFAARAHACVPLTHLESDHRSDHICRTCSYHVHRAAAVVIRPAVARVL